MRRASKILVRRSQSSLERQSIFWRRTAVRKRPKAAARWAHRRPENLNEEPRLTPEEFGKLEEAERNSNGLVKTETVAMNAVKGLFRDDNGQFTRHAAPDLEFARRIMHDAKYHQGKETIMRPIHEFETLLNNRTDAAVRTYQLRGNIWLSAIAFLVVCMGAMVFITIRSVNSILHSAVERLKESVQQMSGAADHVAASSEALAQGASEQAASLEEALASTEEINSITQRNADSARAMSGLTLETIGIIKL